MKKLLFAFLALSALSAEGQNYPQRPIRMIVPFAAGGTTDALGRVLAIFLGERLGQQLVVENRPGGGGTLGAEVAARSQPDGYTLLLGSAEAFGMTEGMRRRLAYNPERDLVPVAMVARAPNILIVHPSVPVTTLAELVGSDFVLGALFGVFVPVNTPHEAIERLSRELPAISRDPDFSRRLVDIGQELTEPLLGEAFGRAIRDEAARWRELSTMAGV